MKDLYHAKPSEVRRMIREGEMQKPTAGLCGGYAQGNLVVLPKATGIKDIFDPEFWDAVEIRKNEVPVFCACGVTPQAVAMNIKPEIMITHAPGHMFLTDIKNQELAVI